MNVISVMGGKIHKRQTFEGGEDFYFPLCRTGDMTNKGTKYKGAEAPVTCSICLSYDAPKIKEKEEAPTRRVTREEWLHLAIEALRPEFAKIGFPLPEKLHVSVGFGYGAKRESAKVLGQCWARRVSEDDVNHIFISPELRDAPRVLDVLAHELVHAADDCKSGHKGAFATAAKALGLTGKMTATVASPEFAERMAALAEELGPYDHATLYPMGKPIQPKEEPKPEDPEGDPEETPSSSGPKKQGTRMIKVACTTDCECGGYVIRTTAKWLEVGMPICPFGTVMEIA
ncbi:hypothetical protein ACFVZH_08085 [Streptomyces sp. NPDC059534]|uniref:hypothetical protein n=1 Tax=Streptomyces sp. NPDC059534 TaxID=3346859 RepID=UPI003697BFAD